MSFNEDPNVWTYRQNSSLAAKLFGCPFFLLGCFFFYGGLTAENINGGPPSIFLRVFFCGFSSIFIFLGLLQIAGFTKVIINKKENSLTEVSGILIPLKSKTADLPKAKEIQFKTKVDRSTDSDGYTSFTTYYPVYMVDQNGQGKEIVKSTNLLKSRRASEELAKLFKLNIVDTSLGITINRDHRSVDDNIRTTLIKNKEKIDKPVPPPNFAHKVKDTYNKYGEQASEVSFGLRLHTGKGPFLLSLGLFIILSSYLTYCCIGLESASGEVKLITRILDNFSFTAVIAGFIDIFCLRSVLRGLIGSKISISRNRILITKSLLLPITKSINMNELEHCLKRVSSQAGKTGKVTFVTDNQFIEAAHEEPEEILDYIVDSVKYKAQ